MTASEIVVVGEGMLELSRATEGWKLSSGGDTLNVAIHLARSGRPTAYLTALGSDPFSAEMKAAWEEEGVDTSLILIDPERHAGLYAIRTDSEGERTFHYWREQAAARHLFAHQGIGAALERAEHARLLVFSLISLAILPAAGRHALLDLAARVRANGGQVAFDGNYRPSLWESVGAARAARDAALAVSNIGLPTLSDETMLDGTYDANEVRDRWITAGTGEVLVKLGAQGCLLPDGQILPPPMPIEPLDTSGAGDAFNGGYLASRISGADTQAAAMAGHHLAGWVICHRGAVPARTQDAPYRGACTTD